MVEAIKQDFPQREIADASFQFQREVDSGKRIVVGVNEYRHADEDALPILRIEPALERKQRDRLEATKGRRDSGEVERALRELKAAASGEENLMPRLLDCARVRASEGEMVASLQEVFGTYTESPIF
jgi:methylmalonyl-CoA mutase N-terminal domain/subunit